MAGDGSRHAVRTRSLIFAAIAFVLTSVLFMYIRTHLDPIPFTMSSHPDHHDIDDDMPATEKLKHHKGGTKKSYPQVSTLPASHLPTDTAISRRLMIIGDVHGHLKSLEALLHEADFSPSRGDTAIFVGDLVNKGPDSAGVVALAMRIGAFAVRGNHEDRVLRAWEYLEAKKRARKSGLDSDHSNSDDRGDDEYEGEGDIFLGENESGTFTDAEHTTGVDSDGTQSRGSEPGLEVEEKEEEEDDSAQSNTHLKKYKKKNGEKKKGKKKKKKKPKGDKHKPRHMDLTTAKSLKPEHRHWLSRLPLILRVGDLGPRYGEVFVVHAGLVPGIPLESQDPEAVMTMRTILLPPPGGYNPTTDSDPPSSHAKDHTTTNNNNNQTPLATSSAATTQSSDQPQDQHPSGEVQEEGEAEEEAARKGRKHHPHDDPAVMIPSASRNGVPWAKIWTSYQQAAAASHERHATTATTPPAAPATVVYGHDAKAGLQMREYAFGVDSGCGNGDALTAVVFEFDGDRRAEHDDNDDDSGDEEEEEEEVEPESRGRRRPAKARIHHRLVSVPCIETER